MATKWSPPVAISLPEVAPSAPQGIHFSGKSHLSNIFLKKFKGIKINAHSFKNEHLREIKAHENIVLENNGKIPFNPEGDQDRADLIEVMLANPKKMHRTRDKRSFYKI